MNEKCIDIGTIQAFLDGELGNELSLKVTNHVSACDSCALVLSEADEENSFVFGVIEREMNSLVPTQRLWSKINDSIAVEQQRVPFSQKIYAFLTTLATPSFATAAVVLIVFSIFTAYWTLRPESTPEPASVAVLEGPRYEVPQAVTREVVPDPTVDGDPNRTSAPTVQEASSRRYSVVRANFRETAAPAKSANTEVRRAAVNAAYLPGEESYVKTIETMDKTVNGQNARSMRPSEQIAFERDLAVVNDAISKMKKEVQRNPRNESAKQVLYTSYQNKIDLLNSVSQREELMASLK